MKPNSSVVLFFSDRSEFINQLEFDLHVYTSERLGLDAYWNSKPLESMGFGKYAMIRSLYAEYRETNP